MHLFCQRSFDGVKSDILAFFKSSYTVNGIFVVVAGVVSTESAAQDQVVFGVSMYAGSTLITLTFIWGLCIILNRDRLRGKEPKQAYENRQDSSTKCLPLRHRLSILNG